MSESLALEGHLPACPVPAVVTQQGCIEKLQSLFGERLFRGTPRAIHRQAQKKRDTQTSKNRDLLPRYNYKIKHYVVYCKHNIHYFAFFAFCSRFKSL